MPDFDQQYENFMLAAEANEELREREQQMQDEDNDLDRKQYLRGSDFKVSSRFNDQDL